VADGNGDGLYAIDIGAVERPGPCLPDARPFTRGDLDRDGKVRLTDVVQNLSSLFANQLAPCMDACDTNDDGDVNLADPVYVLAFLFLDGAPPPAPYPGEGFDLTGDRLGVCR
jgi:hypothetical protein